MITIDEIFEDACYQGYLSLTQWIYQKESSLDIHSKVFGFLENACYKGHLTIAQWLYSLGNVNIHVAEDKAFQEACTPCHLLVVQWLYRLGGISIEVIQTCLEITFSHQVYPWLLSLLIN
jgi:hypothetical protein